MGMDITNVHEPTGKPAAVCGCVLTIAALCDTEPGSLDSTERVMRGMRAVDSEADVRLILGPWTHVRSNVLLWKAETSC